MLFMWKSMLSMFIRIGACIPCFLIIQAPLVPLWRINRRNWLERARPSQQQRETAGAPADNCDRTHHWRSRYRCRDANSNRAQLWAALCIELMTHNLSPCNPYNSNCMYVCVCVHIYLRARFPATVANPQFRCGLCDELANRNWAATGCLNEGHSCALIKSKQRSRIIECIECACHRHKSVGSNDNMSTLTSLSVAAKCANALSNQMQQQQKAHRKRWEQQFVAAAISVQVVGRWRRLAHRSADLPGN